MIFTVTISELALFLAAIAFFILVIYLIPAIIQLRNTAKAIEDFSQKAKEAVENINSLVKKVNGHADEVGDVVKKITDVGRILVNQLKVPVITIASIIAGIEFVFKHLRKKEGDKNVRK